MHMCMCLVIARDTTGHSEWLGVRKWLLSLQRASQYPTRTRAPPLTYEPGCAYNIKIPLFTACAIWNSVSEQYIETTVQRPVDGTRAPGTLVYEFGMGRRPATCTLIYQR
jgi:hypothetical protein